MGAISGTAKGNGSGSFRLGVKTPPARHVLGGANGKRGGDVKAMAVPTTDEDIKIEENGDNYSSATTRLVYKFLFVFGGSCFYLFYFLD